MRKFPTLAALLLAFSLAPAAQAADVDIGVSIGISQPGVYGRIDIGRYPPPVLVQRSPVVIVQRPHRVEPVYLWVPPGHQKNWRKHCHRYQACGAPVYFVQDRWYQEHVHRGHPGKGHDRGRGHHKHDRHHDWDHDRGPGRDHDRDHRRDRH